MLSAQDYQELTRLVRKDRASNFEVRQQTWNKDHLAQVNEKIEAADNLLDKLSDEIERLEENG